MIGKNQMYSMERLPWAYCLSDQSQGRMNCYKCFCQEFFATHFLKMMRLSSSDQNYWTSINFFQKCIDLIYHISVEMMPHAVKCRASPGSLCSLTSCCGQWFSVGEVPGLSVQSFEEGRTPVISVYDFIQPVYK